MNIHHMDCLPKVERDMQRQSEAQETMMTAIWGFRAYKLTYAEKNERLYKLIDSLHDLKDMSIMEGLISSALRSLPPDSTQEFFQDHPEDRLYYCQRSKRTLRHSEFMWEYHHQKVENYWEFFMGKFRIDFEQYLSNKETGEVKTYFEWFKEWNSIQYHSEGEVNGPIYGDFFGSLEVSKKVVKIKHVTKL